MPLVRTSATSSGVGPKVARRSRCQTGSVPSRFGTAAPGSATTEALRIGSEALCGRDGAAATPSVLVAVAFGPAAPVAEVGAALGLGLDAEGLAVEAWVVEGLPAEGLAAPAGF